MNKGKRKQVNFFDEFLINETGLHCLYNEDEIL